jgi:hypothetical protein
MDGLPRATAFWPVRIAAATRLSRFNRSRINLLQLTGGRCACPSIRP